MWGGGGGGGGGGRNGGYRIKLHQSSSQCNKKLNFLGHQIIISRTVLKSNLPEQTSVRF